MELIHLPVESEGGKHFLICAYKRKEILKVRMKAVQSRVLKFRKKFQFHYFIVSHKVTFILHGGGNSIKQCNTVRNFCVTRTRVKKDTSFTGFFL